jgi:hypothetical protein
MDLLTPFFHSYPLPSSIIKLENLVKEFPHFDKKAHYFNYFSQQLINPTQAQTQTLRFNDWQNILLNILLYNYNII